MSGDPFSDRLRRARGGERLARRPEHGLADFDDVAVERTLGSVLKYREDIELVTEQGLAWVAGGG